MNEDRILRPKQIRITVLRGDARGSKLRVLNGSVLKLEKRHARGNSHSFQDDDEVSEFFFAFVNVDPAAAHAGD